MILAGDIGGTNTRLALFEAEGGKPRITLEGRYYNREHNSLEEIVGAFLSKERPALQSACFGVAGPVVNGRALAPNLAWLIDAAQLSKALELTPLWLINDLQAHAYALDVLSKEDFVTLNRSKPQPMGNVALIAPGTGLGEAGVLRNRARSYPFASEGGHADFAARSELEIQLLRYLMSRYGRVSYERVLSGPGLVNIFNFLRDTGRAPVPVWLDDELTRSTDAAAVISQAALEHNVSICEQALELFVAVLAAEAGNMALKFMATGGVFIGGGIAPKILPKLRSASFLEAFFSKGRMRPLLESIPVTVVVNDRSGLIGAARYAIIEATMLPTEVATGSSANR